MGVYALLLFLFLFFNQSFKSAFARLGIQQIQLYVSDLDDADAKEQSKIVSYRPPNDKVKARVSLQGVHVVRIHNKKLYITPTEDVCACVFIKNLDPRRIYPRGETNDEEPLEVIPNSHVMLISEQDCNTKLNCYDYEKAMSDDNIEQTRSKLILDLIKEKNLEHIVLVSLGNTTEKVPKYSYVRYENNDGNNSR